MTRTPNPAAESVVRLTTLDPGHFHAALVQKSMYPQVDPVVHVYSPGGADLDQHLKRIEGFNTRAVQPTQWRETVYSGPDCLEKLIADRAGNVVVIAGNNTRKAEYILRCVQAGLNVLADKPMAITPADLPKLQEAFAVAERKGVLLYDIMTERYETTTQLQRELSRIPGLFGTLEKGSATEPAVTKESVHHYFKHVSGKPLVRPAWYFDVAQQGEGIVDVTTHLVDMVQWECFPEELLNTSDVTMLSARRWPTRVTPEQFRRVTGLEPFPGFLQSSVQPDGSLAVYANGEFTYTLRGVACKVSVIWNFEAPAGAGDTHYSIMRGSRANLVIRQGPEQAYKPTLYVEGVTLAGNALTDQLNRAVAGLQPRFPGFSARPVAQGFEIGVPHALGHEDHFAQVTAAYLEFLKRGALPAWEVPNMRVKYHTTMEAWRLSR